MAMVCGKHGHDMARIEGAFYGNARAATIYEQRIGHENRENPTGACYCGVCQQQVMKPATTHVKCMEEVDCELGWIESYDKPLIYQPDTDIPVHTIRKVTCTTHIIPKVVAIVYTYVDALTGNKGLNALGLGLITTPVSYTHLTLPTIVRG